MNNFFVNHASNLWQLLQNSFDIKYEVKDEAEIIEYISNTLTKVSEETIQKLMTKDFSDYLNKNNHE